VILSVLVFLWGLPDIKTWLNGISAPKFPIDGLHNLVVRVPPVVPKPTPEAAVYTLNWLSATGSGNPDRGNHRRTGDGHLGPEARANVRLKR
jgi:lactate permease